jgi:hypothetical protein
VKIRLPAGTPRPLSKPLLVVRLYHPGRKVFEIGYYRAIVTRGRWLA